MNKNQKSIVLAFDKGYHVTEQGEVISCTGKKLKIKLSKGVRYPRLSVNLPEIDPKNSVSIAIHQLAAYCFYGDLLFNKNIVVRHLNADRYDVSRKNIVLGTQKENMEDKKRIDKISTPSFIQSHPKSKDYVPDNMHLGILSKCFQLPLSQGNLAILLAYKKGYRVTENGDFLNPKGQILKISGNSRKRYDYPRFSIPAYKEFGKRTVSFKTHRLASFCFYGEKMFDKNIEVRHLNGNVLDISKNNLILGTKEENENDKNKDAVKKSITHAHKFSLEATRKLSEEQVIEVKKLLSKKCTNVHIGKIFNVSAATISRIKTGATYQ